MDVRRCLPVALAAASLVASGGASAEEIWMIHSGTTSVNLYESLLTDLGLSIEATETADDPSSAEAHMEPPFYTFRIDSGTDLTFRVRAGQAVARGFVGGSIQHAGGCVIRHAASGYAADMRDFVIDFRQGVDGPRDAHVTRDWLFMHGRTSTVPQVELTDSEPVFDRGAELLSIYNLTLLMSTEWAKAIGRPDLAGQTIGTMYVRGETRWVSGVDTDHLPPPEDLGSLLDVELGFLYTITSLGHEGTFPNGRAGLSMSTTSCNPGDVPVPWQAAMQENHPVISQQFYRVQNGRLEQVGVAWVKHGFFALSSNECGYGCSGTDGTSLGVGCSDTYGTGNNGDRYWLGPRKEVNPYTGEWECTGSFFSGFQPDCNRRESGSGWGSVAHRIEVADADLGVSGADYYFEGYYVVRGDQNKTNNIAFRKCTTSWTGSNWNVHETGAMTQTPIALTWGDMQSTVSYHGDGEVIVSTRVVDLGATKRYEYNVFNRDSDRQIREFKVPVGTSSVSNATFHDWDTNDGSPTNNDWTPTVADGYVTWSTSTFAADPNANALMYGLMFTFTFESDGAPHDNVATLGYFKPGAPMQITAETKAPAVLVAVEPGVGPSVARLSDARPNPLNAGTTIRFELSKREHVVLSIYDTQGRLVRGLVDRTESVGAHEASWDGRDVNGARVSPGVYYYRMQAGDFQMGKSVVVVQ